MKHISDNTRNNLNVIMNQKVSCKTTLETEGQGGLFELAERLQMNLKIFYKDKEWDGEYFDTIMTLQIKNYLK